VLGPFGLKGELKVQSLTDNPRRFSRGSRIYAGREEVRIAAVRAASGHLYLTFKGHGDRTSAERFRHALLQIHEDELPPLPAGEYYRYQLIGLDVLDASGEAIGTLAEVIETGSNDVYRVRRTDGGDLLLPALDDVVLSVDLQARRMTVDPPAWR
jgi:16S rRNA processing protein RimM